MPEQYHVVQTKIVKIGRALDDAGKWRSAQRALLASEERLAATFRAAKDLNIVGEVRTATSITIAEYERIVEEHPDPTTGRKA